MKLVDDVWGVAMDVVEGVQVQNRGQKIRVSHVCARDISI